MKAFGYMRGEQEAEQPLELQEIALSLSADEIEVLIAFLQNSKMRFAASCPTPGQSHLHLRDWWKDWNTTDSDLIVVYDEPGARKQ
jgi:hypothetical protein